MKIQAKVPWRWELGAALLAACVAVQCASRAPRESSTAPPPAPAGSHDASTDDATPQTRTASEGSDSMSRSTPERDTIAAKHKWNTTHLFKSDVEWERARKALEASFAEIEACKGKLRRGKAMVLRCLQRVFEANQQLARLTNYAHRLHDQDTRVARYAGFKEVMDKLAADFAEATAFLQPELLALPRERIRAMIRDPRFSDYDQYLRELLRLRPHILSPAQETLLASMSLMQDAGYNAYSTFANADLEFPSIKDEKGRPAQLTQALFTRYRASGNRRVRKGAFNAFFGTYAQYKNTIATMLGAQINANIVYARARRYDSALEAALDGNNIPTSVYHNMIKAIHRHLPLLHRYLELRQRLLGVEQLRYYDMYPPIVKKVEMKYTYDQARALLVEALAPMGEEYVRELASGLDPDSGWVDVYPNKGKRSGAYMDGSAYDVHPYVLCNFLDNYNSVSTLAHEMGHAMHSFYSNRSQPYSKSDYSIFVAEVASTLNEALLMDHMLAGTDDPRKQLYLLGEKLEDFRQTVFRQSMFAEFELALYRRAERKEALTADQITRIYLEIVRRYNGHDAGVVTVDDLYGMEWAYVPHFYYNFYVFQYVTGMTAATALARLVKRDGARARDRYIKHLLRAGGSDYSIKLLKRAGVDLTTTKPYEIAMADFEDALKRAEAVVARLEAGKGKGR